MRQHCLFVSLFLVLLVLGSAADVASAPIDTKVGDVRATYNRAGTPLRGKASALAAPTASLPYGTQVRVLEKTKGWLRIQTVGGGASQTGWLRSFHTVEPAALRTNATPAHLTAREGVGVDRREVSAAGRQFDADTEKGYRASRRELAAAYRAVDAMEAATQAMDPGESLVFMDSGDLGRAGRDYARPARIPGGAGGRPRTTKRKVIPGGGLIGGLLGEGARRLGAGNKVADVAQSAFEAFSDNYVQEIRQKFSPRQEYFLGRAVAAEAIAKYGVEPDANLRRYVRLVGDAIVRLSSRLPGNFGGYHFEVLDSDEINGISGPGGFVLVTRGAVKACRSESELAGIVAHELAHIGKKHAEGLLRRDPQFGSLLKPLAAAAGAGAGAAAGGERGRMLQGGIGAFGNFVAHAKKTAIDHGYGRQLEFDADNEGTQLLFDVYYDQGALQRVLARLPAKSHGAAATHAPPAVRAQALGTAIARLPAYKIRPVAQENRDARFQKATGITVLPPK